MALILKCQIRATGVPREVLKAIGANRIDHPAVNASGAIGHPVAQYRSAIEQLAADSTDEGLNRAVLAAALKTVK